MIIYLFTSVSQIIPAEASFKYIIHKKVSNIKPNSVEHLPLSNCVISEHNDVKFPINAYRNEKYNIDVSKPIKVLIYLIDFTDLPGYKDRGINFHNLETGIEEYYASISHGSMKFIWTQSLSFARISKDIKEYNSVNRLKLNDAVQIILDAQKLAASEYFLKDFDYFIAATPEQTTTSEISTSISYLQKDSNFINSTILAGDYWQSNQSWAIPAHEIGHALGLVDLYSIDAALKNEESSGNYHDQFKYMGFFDLMNWPTGPAPEMTAWNRWILGFLLENEIKCLPESKSETWLAAIEDSVQSTKALFLKLDERRLVIVEHRASKGLDNRLSDRAAGVIVYIVNYDMESGTGPVRLVFKEQGGRNPFFGAVLHVGESVKVAGFTIGNLKIAKARALVKVTRS